ncbi:hypothetical protein VC87395_001221 [Vibrio paracholerae 87395]|nr:hypothetical protein VCHE09_0996 [Vibrio paracholerae HE-09]EMP93590.1 hypothetical protein VC87395_001221 [Vibrio paracholerae 87395]
MNEENECNERSNISFLLVLHVYGCCANPFGYVMRCDDFSNR